MLASTLMCVLAALQAAVEEEEEDEPATPGAPHQYRESAWPYSPPQARSRDGRQGPSTPHSDNSDPWDEELRHWPPRTHEAMVLSPPQTSRASSREIEAVTVQKAQRLP